MDKKQCMVKRWHIGGGVTIIFSKVIKADKTQNAPESCTDNKTQNAPEKLLNTGQACEA